MQPSGRLADKPPASFLAYMPLRRSLSARSSTPPPPPQQPAPPPHPPGATAHAWLESQRSTPTPGPQQQPSPDAAAPWVMMSGQHHTSASSQQPPGPSAGTAGGPTSLRRSSEPSGIGILAATHSATRPDHGAAASGGGGGGGLAGITARQLMRGALAAAGPAPHPTTSLGPSYSVLTNGSVVGDARAQQHHYQQPVDELARTAASTPTVFSEVDDDVMHVMMVLDESGLRSSRGMLGLGPRLPGGPYAARGPAAKVAAGRLPGQGAGRGGSQHRSDGRGGGGVVAQR